MELFQFCRRDIISRDCIVCRFALWRTGIQQSSTWKLTRLSEFIIVPVRYSMPTYLRALDVAVKEQSRYHSPITYCLGPSRSFAYTWAMSFITRVRVSKRQYTSLVLPLGVSVTIVQIVQESVVVISFPRLNSAPLPSLANRYFTILNVLGTTWKLKIIVSHNEPPARHSMTKCL